MSLWYGAVAVLGLAPAARAQSDPPALRAVRLGEDDGPVIRLDGRLDESVWAQGTGTTDFRQREPSEGAPATEATEVRVLYDRSTLYVGIAARDSRPEAVIARILQRDRIMQVEPFEQALVFAGDDAVAILFDPFHDHRNAVVFATNPNGAEFDALITDEGRELNADWRAVWRVAAARTADGWSAEFAIPFTSLRYPPGDNAKPWGFNVYRTIRRKNEEVLLAAWSRANEGFERVSRAAHLTDLTGLPQPGMNLEVKPYVLSGAVQETDAGVRDTDPRLEAGVDAKYQLTSGLLLDVTANTDFAQVEVDDERVNLTRFDLFFPEKRDFFLENAGVFEFGLRSFFEPPPFLLFFSRRIGIHDDGEVPVIGGLRLTGRAGRQTLGLLDVVTDAAFGEPRTNFAVARVKRDVGESNYIGAMAVDRRNAAESNTATGADWSFWPSSAVNLQGFAARTWTSGAGGEGSAYRLAADWQRDRFGVTAEFLSIGPEATADMGFITRADIHRADAFGRLTPRPKLAGLRKIDVFWNVQVITRTDGLLQDWYTGPAVGPEWESGESLVGFAQRGFTRIDEEFDLSDSVQVAVGDYDVWQYGWFFNTSRNRPVFVESTAFVQRTYGGHLTTIDTRVTAALGSNLALTAGYGYNVAEVTGDAFTADLLSLRLGIALSTKLAVNGLIQYNSLDREVSANIRLNFIHAPGSDLFVVLNERRGSPQSLWDPQDRGGVVKLTYLKRL